MTGSCQPTHMGLAGKMQLAPLRTFLAKRLGKFGPRLAVVWDWCAYAVIAWLSNG